MLVAVCLLTAHKTSKEHVMTISTSYSETFDPRTLTQISDIINSSGYLDTTDVTQPGNCWTAWTSVWDETVTIAPEDAREIIPASEVKAQIDALDITGLTVVIE